MTYSRIKELLDISARISRGEVPEYQHNECYTSGAFDLLLVHAHGADAFQLLGELCEEYREVKKSGKGLKGYFSLLSILAVNARTTELPDGMIDIIAENPELSGELRNWYRVSG